MLKAVRTAVVLYAVIAAPARAQTPADPRCAAHVVFLYQYGRSPFEELVAGGERCAQFGAPDAANHLVFAGGYWDRAYHDPTFDDRLTDRYADSGLACRRTKSQRFRVSTTRPRAVANSTTSLSVIARFAWPAS